MGFYTKQGVWVDYPSTLQSNVKTQTGHISNSVGMPGVMNSDRKPEFHNVRNSEQFVVGTDGRKVFYSQTPYKAGEEIVCITRSHPSFGDIIHNRVKECMADQINWKKVVGIED